MEYYIVRKSTCYSDSTVGISQDKEKMERLFFEKKEKAVCFEEVALSLTKVTVNESGKVLSEQEVLYSFQG